MSSRLFTEVRERRGLCYAISATLSTLRRRPRLCVRRNDNGEGSGNARRHRGGDSAIAGRHH